MYKNHPYAVHRTCPCDIGTEAVQKAIDIYRAFPHAALFADEMEPQRVIGKRIWYDEDKNTIFITKMYACNSGGGCPENKNRIGQRCHCPHYNHSKDFYPKQYCKCGAEFYRPMFAPIFGEGVLIEPYKTVLSGDEECVLAIRVDKTEGL